MKMRKILVLLLCFAMLLGMIPGTAFAASYEQGLYAAMDGTGVLSGRIAQDTEAPYGCTISYTAGEGTTVYCYMENAVSYEVDGAGLSIAKADGFDNIYAITLAAGKWGRIEGSVQFTNTFGGTPGFPLTFTDGTKQLYLWMNESLYVSGVSLEAGGAGQPFVFTIDENGTATDGSYTYSCTEGLGTVVWDSDKEQVLWTPGTEPAEGRITAAKDGETYAIDAVVLVSSGGGQGGSEEENPFELIRMISDRHETTSEDLCADTSWLSEDGYLMKNSATAEFRLNGETYYMGISLHGETYPSSGHGMSFSLTEHEKQTVYFDIGFYIALPGNEEFARITDHETLAAIKQAFGETLKLKVTGLTYTPRGFTAPTVFPALYEARGDAQCAACTALKLGVENRGGYALIATGTVNGEEICTQITYHWSPQQELVFEPEGDDVIDQINEYLENIDPELRATLTINLPAGEHEGYIIVPENRMDIAIIGANLGQNGAYTTLIRGGIQSEGFSVATTGIRFLGAGGEDNANDSPKKWPNGTDNICLLGGGFIRADGCLFEGYDIAMCGKEVLKFGTGNTFINNNTAVLLDTTGNQHAMTKLEGNTFIKNGIAIAFYQIPADFSVSAISMTGCCFVDNDVDIWNKLNQNIFLPGCYFAYTDNGEERLRECQYRPVARGNAQKQVLYYPQADSRACDSFIYDTSFYERQPVVSVNFTRIFPIPAAALDGAEFTVMKGDTELARISYETPAARTYSMRNRSSGVFDATVEVVRTGDVRIDITLQAIPDGKTPTIYVPCEAGWKSVSVTDPQGNELEAIVSDGYVSFVAEQGGTYTITNTTPPEYAILFDANGGSGTMDSVTVSEGEQYRMPECTFTAPDGQQFKEWMISGTAYQPNDIYTVRSETTVVAIWEDASSDIPGIPDEPWTPVIPVYPVFPNIPDEPTIESETVRNEDGSTTITVTDKTTGTVTQTTELSDGSSLKIVTTNDGEREISVSVPKNVVTKVTIPAENVGMGTVAVMIHSDGTEQIIQQSVPGEDGLTVTLSESAQLKLVDNAKTFSDVTDSWFKDAVDFVSARGIMNGTGDNVFDYSGVTTRAMVWTMLARLRDVDTSGGVSWWEKGCNWAMDYGISDGTNANGAITREQLAVMLWRLSGSPELAGLDQEVLAPFPDADSVSSYAQNALVWAVDSGIIAGMGDGTLNPGGHATRAQVAQILMNYMMRA